MIGTNIKRIRMKKGLSLSELAERAQISKSYLSNIERNKNQNISIHILEKLAGVLAVNFHELHGSAFYKGEPLEDEWIAFVNELKKSGVTTSELSEYKTVIEFAKWKKEHVRASFDEYYEHATENRK